MAKELLDWYTPVIQSKDNVVWFAIYVKPAYRTSEKSEFAGTIAYLNADPANASCEIGHVG
jgi:hypothetical protein